MPEAPLLPTADLTLGEGLRREVGWLRRVERRRVFPARIHLGHPGTPRSLASDALGPLNGAPWPLPPWMDAGARRDACDRLAGRWRAELGAMPTWCWLTRPGQPHLHDEDPGWLSAALWALDAHGVDLLGFRVVTRHGWLDPATGEVRRWKRLRLVRPG